MKSYLVQFRNGKPTLKFNGYIYEDKEDDWNEPTLYPDEIPDYIDEGDMVYFDKLGDLHLIDARPIKEYDKVLNENMFDENGYMKKPTPEEYAKILVYQTLLWGYQREPKLLSGSEEKEYISWKQEEWKRKLEEIEGGN